MIICLTNDAFLQYINLNYSVFVSNPLVYLEGDLRRPSSKSWTKITHVQLRFFINFIFVKIDVSTAATWQFIFSFEQDL